MRFDISSCHRTCLVGQFICRENLALLSATEGGAPPEVEEDEDFDLVPNSTSMAQIPNSVAVASEAATAAGAAQAAAR
jgi:hypothetical protein